MQKYINSPKNMKKLGKQISQKHSKLLLQGPLGAGKTQLCKGFGQGLDINPSKIKSPTYKYLNIYQNKLLHIDMYRIDSFEKLIQKGIINHINKFKHIMIERPKFKSKYIHQHNRTKIQIEKTSPKKRKVIIN